jgi:NADPH2:quinone reductase
MRALVVHEFGGPEVMKIEDIAPPTAGPGQIVIRVRAIGVNPVDTYIRSGMYARKPNLPYTPHADIAGVVEAVGNGVTTVKQGDRVYAYMIEGGGAELARAEEWQVQRDGVACAVSESPSAARRNGAGSRRQWRRRHGCGAARTRSRDASDRDGGHRGRRAAST